MRSFDAHKIYQAVMFFVDGEHPEFDAIEWVSNRSNIALENERGDLAVFERETPRVVTGHYYFQSRGRQAVQSGKELLSELWSTTDTMVIRGLTPLTNLGARWMSRHLGFTSHGVVYVTTGPHELFMLSRT